MFFNKKNYKPGLYDIGDPELDHWNIINIDNPDLGLLIVRVRKSKPPIPDIHLYQTAIEIEWNYSRASHDMPDDQHQQKIKQFEHAIQDLCWYNNLSFNIRANTGLGSKVWVFYTKSYDEFGEMFNKLLCKQPEFPITMSYCHDPDWKLWRNCIEDHVVNC